MTEHHDAGRSSVHLEQRLITTPQAAIHLGVSPRTVKNLMRNGKLPYIKIGRSTRFDPDDLATFIARHRRKTRRTQSL